MATQLFKLVIDAATTTDTAINPEVDKYFYVPTLFPPNQVLASDYSTI